MTDRIAAPAGRLAVLAASLLSVVALAGPGLNLVTTGVTRLVGHRIGVTANAPASSDESNKGVCVWAFAGVNTALKESRAAWYLTWSTSHDGIVVPRGVQFVPMVRDAADVTPDDLAQAEQSGPALLTFNEPDLSAQANMTVSSALSLWPKLMATNLELGSPAVATGAATPGGWLDRFMKGVQQHRYRVNFIAVHWYGADFQTGAAVAQLRTYLNSVHRRYGRPVWLTEYALTDFTATGPIFPTGAQQAAFVTASVRMLDSLGFVQRFAWFALPAPSSGPSTGLFASGPRETAAGAAFARA